MRTRCGRPARQAQPVPRYREPGGSSEPSLLAGVTGVEPWYVQAVAQSDRHSGMRRPVCAADRGLQQWRAGAGPVGIAELDSDEQRVGAA